MLERFRLPVQPIADPAAIVQGEHYRISVLAAGLIRLEYSESGQFEDRASQLAVDRAFAPGPFQLTEAEDRLEIHTERFELRYDKRPFSAEGLSVRAKGGYHSLRSLWRFGEPTANLGGTARTLDEVDGATPLESGVLSRDGITVVDDSHTMLLTGGWIAPRRPGNLDLYVFAYGHDYKQALRSLYKLAGPQPLLPRYALGNWWSRYHPYSAAEYLELMDRFQAAGIPFAVAVIDMDWHLVAIDPRYGSGWTGYTWNPELFSDPAAFLGELHRRGLATSLNVHPAEGVHAHEAAYARLATRLGIDPASERPVDFDPTDPAFVEAYFEELHHPLEQQGVDFWWLDWQQGGVTKIAGLDPLWLLNHFHFLDSGRSGRRPLTFSRYAGVGSHRYPIGFSGDTIISWATLAFQPYFTATAANVGYGWWSHDIGGHFGGRKDDELVIRWTQLGTFSPILRLHSSLSPFQTKEPWRFGEQAERIMTRFLRLRHQLVPYLYTMNRRAHEDGEPLVQPMYYDHPEIPASYEVPNQYHFGDRLVVAPITMPVDPATRLGAVSAWLPPGDWFDFFTGLHYTGDRNLLLHRGLDSVPVLVAAGAILPLSPVDATGFGTANPAELEIRVYAGPAGEFVLAEDGDDERWAETRFTFEPDTGRFEIHPVTGDRGSVPATRRYELVLCGFRAIAGASVLGPDGPLEVSGLGDDVPGAVRIALPEVTAAGGLVVEISGELEPATNRDVPDRLFTLLDQAQIQFTVKEAIYRAGQRPVAEAVSELAALGLATPLLDAVLELLLADRAMEH
jgi:alpha-glucosidase (family GH31 glycosyl hydrolase)